MEVAEPKAPSWGRCSGEWVSPGEVDGMGLVGVMGLGREIRRLEVTWYKMGLYCGIEQWGSAVINFVQVG